MILGAIIGYMLESSGTLTKENLGCKGAATIILIYFALFCLAAFVLVPLVLRGFVVMQGAVGNAEFFLVKWIRANEQKAVYCVWGFFSLGLAVAFLLNRNEIFRYFK